MNIFDIIGPIIIGPSSSHTAGAVRIGNMARLILSDDVTDAKITLYGSFAKTYKGHGTDRAVIGGLLGFGVDDERIKKSFTHAHKIGLTYDFQISEDTPSHPNTISLSVKGRNDNFAQIVAQSTGGGAIFISQIDGIDVSFCGEYNTLVIHHIDTQGVIAAVTKILSDESINIAFMKVFREKRGEKSIMVIEVDQSINSGTVENIRSVPNIFNVVFLKPI